MFYTLLPLVAYATLALSAFTSAFHSWETVFAVGAAALHLLLVGIRSAWDSIAYPRIRRWPGYKALNGAE